VDLQLWTISRLGRITPASLRREVTFYAPLLEHLDFLGIEPVTFTRASSSVAVRRDGQNYTIGPNVPRFNYSGETNLGLMLQSGEVLQYSVYNALDNANTVIWFEENGPKSTPTNTNPFNSSGQWAGNLNVHIKHICKFSRQLSNAEINSVQAALAEVVQVIPPPLPPPSFTIGLFVNEVPAGSGTVYTLSSNPDLGSLIVDAHGVTLKRVASAPGNMEFTASGTGNRTLTLGMAPSGVAPFQCWYVITG
jgi:hypothetical protein